MSARILDGKAMADTILAVVHDKVAEREVQGKRRPGLAVILVGGDPASAVYVRNKKRACERAGVTSVSNDLPTTTTQDELLALIDTLNADTAIDGILVQLPLPAHIRTEAAIATVDPAKDVDGFHPVNVGKLMLGDDSGFKPCTPAGIQELLARSNVKTSGAEVVVLGRGNIVGKPMAAMLCQKARHANATVTICHSATRDIAAHCRRADILIAAMGVAEFVKADMVKPGAVVIDVGVNRVDDPSTKTGYRLVGDVAFAAVQPIAGLITPNPGGVGPMTIALLMQNTVRAAELACA